MARTTTKPATNAAVTAKPQRVAGIRIADGSKLVGVLFNSDMVTVLGFVLQGPQGGHSIDTVKEFSKKVRITDYVDAYGRCIPRKLREFQSRDGGSLPLSRVLRSDNKTQVKLDPEKITVEQLNVLLGSGAFTPLPDYALVKGLIRRASNQADAQSGKYVDTEGLMGINLLLHYPDLTRKKKVKDANGQIKLVPTKIKEHTVEKFLTVYDAYSLPFEVKKYAIKRTSVKTALGATTPLFNYYVSIKKDGLEACPTATPTVEQAAMYLLPKETEPKYNPGFDADIVQAMFLLQDNIDTFRNNGVYIKGAGAAAPVSAVKADYTSKDLFDIDEVEEDAVGDVTAVEETAPAEEENNFVGDAPVDTAEDIGGEIPDEAVSEEVPDKVDDSFLGLFEGVTFVDKPTVSGDGDLSSPTDQGVTLPETLKTSGLLSENNAKILAEAYNKWNALCDKLQEVANAIRDGVPYSYGGADKTLPVPKAYEGNAGIVYEDKEARNASLVFGDTKKGTKYPLLTLNSINVKISRSFYADFMEGVRRVPVQSNLSYDTITLYAFDGKPKGDAGFGIDLPSGEHFTSSDIHKELQEISKLMHSVGDDLLQMNVALTFINAGNAAVWRQSIKERRKELGLNTTAVEKSESMELRISKMISANVPAGDDAVREIVMQMAFGGNSVTNYESSIIPYDPVTSEYRGGARTTTSEWVAGGNVARAVEDLEAQDNNTADYKPSKSAQVVAFVNGQRAREGGRAYSREKRIEAIAEMAAEAVIEDLKTKTEVSPDFDWDSYKTLKAYTLAQAASKQVGVEKEDKSASSNYALSFDMRIDDKDIASMQASGIELSEESPIRVHAAEKLDSNVKAMVLWLLGTVGVGKNTNDGLQFVGGDPEMLGLWKDKSKAARAGASTHTSSYEFVAASAIGTFTFGASLKQPVE